MCVLYRKIDRDFLGHLLGQVLAQDHQRDAGRAEVLLRARVNQAELVRIERPRQHVRRHVRHERRLGLRKRLPLRAGDGLVRGDVHVGRARRQLQAGPAGSRVGISLPVSAMTLTLPMILASLMAFEAHAPEST